MRRSMAATGWSSGASLPTQTFHPFGLTGHFIMTDRETAWPAHLRACLTCPDAQRWIQQNAKRSIRPDVARFLKPGTDPADVYPALARERDARQAKLDREFTEAIAQERALLDGLRAELASIKAELARRRALREQEAKYSPNQPRIPAGSGRESGRWTDGHGYGPGAAVASPMADGTTDVGRSADDSSESLAFNEINTPDLWTRIIGDDLNKPGPIPNASLEDIPENLEEVNARRGNSISRDFPGASAQQLSRLDQAIARSEDAQTRIRQYEPDWKSTEQSLRAPGSVEGVIGEAEARASEAETHLNQLRTGIGGNFGPTLQPPLRLAPLSSRLFDGSAWIDAYRTINNAPNLFGEPSWPFDRGTVAVSKIGDQVYFGVNSGAPSYTNTDRNNATTMRDYFVEKYPDIVSTTDLGRYPNDAFYHAESTLLLRAAI